MTVEMLYYLSAFLFCMGLLIVITKRHAILMLMGIELMLNAANLRLVASPWSLQTNDGQMMALFVIIVAVCEAAVGLAIVIRAYRQYKTVVVDKIATLKEEW